MSKIGLIDIEPKIFNTAYMQIAYHHKQQGDTVEWAAPLEYDKYDKLYCSSIFGFTNKTQVPDRAICGGTGFDLTTILPFDCDYDYSIYPTCDRSFVWFSRGCIRDCSFCIVQQKEGKLKAVEPKKLNPNGKYIVVQDNNFFANRTWRGAILYLNAKRQPVDFQGVDVRIINRDQCKALSKMRHYKQIKIAWDDPRDNLTERMCNLLTYIPPHKVMCYVLIGHASNINQDIMRIKALRKLKISPYVMCIDRQNPYQKKFQRWVNGHAYRNIEWGDFK